MKTADDDMTNRELFEYSSEMFEIIVDNMATKQDLDAMEARLTDKMSTMATKDELMDLEKRLENRLEGMEDRLAAKINNLRIVSA